MIAAAISASGSITATTSTPRSAADRARRLEPGGGGRVAGDHDQLRAAVEQVGGVALDALAQLGVGLRAVGKARVVAEVEVVLLGQRDEALVQHGEPADAGVEDGDRQRRDLGRRGSSLRDCRGLRDWREHARPDDDGSTLSLWSEDSLLSICSKGSVLSIGSVGSALSIGSVGLGRVGVLGRLGGVGRLGDVGRLALSR